MARKLLRLPAVMERTGLSQRQAPNEHRDSTALGAVADMIVSLDHDNSPLPTTPRDVRRCRRVCVPLVPRCDVVSPGECPPPRPARGEAAAGRDRSGFADAVGPDEWPHRGGDDAKTAYLAKID